MTQRLAVIRSLRKAKHCRPRAYLQVSFLTLQNVNDHATIDSFEALFQADCDQQCPELR